MDVQDAHDEVSKDVPATGDATVTGPAVPSLELLVARVLGAPEHEVTGTTGPTSDSRWTSLRHLQIVAEIRRTFGVVLTPRQVRSVRDVAGLQALVREGA